MFDKIFSTVITVAFWIWLGIDIHNNDKKHGVDNWVIPIFYGVFFGGMMLLAIWCV